VVITNGKTDRNMGKDKLKLNSMLAVDPKPLGALLVEQQSCEDVNVDKTAGCRHVDDNPLISRDILADKLVTIEMKVFDRW